MTYNLETFYQAESPAFGDVTDYPDVLVVGDILFPMLYIYYYGDPANRAKVGNASLFENALTEFWDNRTSQQGYGLAESRTSPGTMTKEQFKVNLNKFYRMFTSAEKNNPTFFWQMNNALAGLMQRYQSRLPKVRGDYYYGKDGQGTSYFPFLDSTDKNNLHNMMETLRLLFENGLIDWQFDLGVRPISLYDGSFADLDSMVIEQQQNARILGVPIKGVFTINNAPRSNWMYHTFTGTDIKAVASLNSVVTSIEGMTSLSWSVHRGKSVPRPLGHASPSARAGGSRTIAGTMVFTISDHNPLLDIIPDELPLRKKNAIPQDKSMWKPAMMADQIPPFDLLIIMTNEYGYSSAFTLYGIEISDEGGVISVDNLAIEMTVQYTAVAMDPIVQAKADENGYIDPYGILQGGYSQFWKQREVVINGVAYSDLHEAYEAQYDSIDKTIRAINTGKLLTRNDARQNRAR